MPATPTYPGVYVEEVPTGVRAISGVATSIAAFVGWSPRGPSDKAVRVLSWSDYEDQFGGLDVRSLLGYAVYHFFANGGTRAYIVRLVANDAAAATANLDSVISVSAKNEGSWANDYGIAIKARSDDASRFRLSIVQSLEDGAKVTVESFENLRMDSEDSRSIETVVNRESAFVKVSVTTVSPLAAPPADTAPPSSVPLTGGSDGTVLVPNASAFEAQLDPVSRNGGVYHLDHIDLFNILCVPGESNPAVLAKLQKFCRDRRKFLIADCAEADTYACLRSGLNTSLTGVDASNAAFYFPWVNAPDPLNENRPRAFPPCGFMAGLYARTDASRGVWKAPAGVEASLSGVNGPTRTLTDDEKGILNVQAINCICTFPVYGTISWGARTLHGNEERDSEWKYVPVRRMALFLEESLHRGLQWAVFEPNDEPLWAQIRFHVGVFMQNLFRQGAFQGETPHDAYFVKCDKGTTTQNDINKGIVNILIGFAPLKPAEFVIIYIQQIAGQQEI